MSERKKQKILVKRQEKIIIAGAIFILLSIVVFLIVLSVLPNKIHEVCRDGTYEVKDMDGNKYKTVQIGRQCWIVGNLNVGVMLEDAKQKPEDNKEPYKWCYNNEEKNCEKYGGLYTWYNAMLVDEKESGDICPEGWKIPSNEDWMKLERFMCKYLRENDCNLLVSDKIEDVGWFGSEGGEFLREEYFTLAGHRNTLGVFERRGVIGNWWSSDRVDFEDSAWRRSLNEGYSGIYRNYGTTANGYSVTCIQDKDY